MRKNSPEVTDLSAFSDIVKKMGEERRQKEDEVLATMQAGFADEVAKIAEKTNEELLQHFESYSQRGCADPRQTAVYLDLAAEYRKEILKRMEKS